MYARNVSQVSSPRLPHISCLLSQLEWSVVQFRTTSTRPEPFIHILIPATLFNSEGYIYAKFVNSIAILKLQLSEMFDLFCGPVDNRNDNSRCLEAFWAQFIFGVTEIEMITMTTF